MVKNMKLMRDNLDDKYGIVHLQEKILEIAKYINDFCKENNIEYCLMGGSALGAVRHKGFIPWDDDLDIFMTPDNYEKFRRLFFEKGDLEKYYLQEYGLQKNGMVTIPKLRMNNTTYVEELTKTWNIHQGIFVDIFILHKCPNSIIKRKWQYFWSKCVVVKGMSLRHYSRQKGIKQLLIFIARFLPYRLMVSFALKQVYRYRNIDSDFFCNYLGKAGYKKGTYEKKWFEKTKAVPFEKIELQVPFFVEDFLTKRFGDYMAIPPESRIKWEQHALYWDLNNGQIGKNGDSLFFDERKLV